MLNSVLDKPTISISRIDKVKNVILKCIYDNPGIRYREILKLTGLSNGVLEYHLKILEGGYKIINVDRHKSKITRYYPLYFEPSYESEVLCHIRNDTTVNIVFCKYCIIGIEDQNNTYNFNGFYSLTFSQL